MHKRIQYSIALACLLALIPIFAFSHQVAAQSTANRNQLASSFQCVKAPKVIPPPDLAQHPAVKQAIKPTCGASDEVPQPIGLTLSSKRHAPAPMNINRANIAAGYHYVYGYQLATASGGQAIFSQHTPNLSTTDYHTLAETAAESADSKQIVEIGWNVDRGVNGDANTHLFVFSWVNGTGNCYNGCGYVQYSSSVRPGQVIAGDGSSYSYAIQYFSGNWWLYSQNQWVGYFPGTLWSNQGVNFTQVGLVQWFGEVAANGGSGTQMGNGVFGSNSGSATITSTALINADGSTTPANPSVNDTDPSCFNHRTISSDSFGYGGPGC
jgi:Neprosin